jgi:hypothetical protein
MNAILIWALPLHFAGLLHTRAGKVLNEAALEDDEDEQRLPIMPVESAKYCPFIRPSPNGSAYDERSCSTLRDQAK